jgi:hypothetical protein
MMGEHTASRHASPDLRRAIMPEKLHVRRIALHRTIFSERLREILPRNRIGSASPNASYRIYILSPTELENVHEQQF